MKHTDDKSNMFFILGARDPEMIAIERILILHGISFAYAINSNGQKVTKHEAYGAKGISTSLPDRNRTFLIFVECAILGLVPDLLIDHHREGDAGFDCEPERYFEGSSIGQVHNLLGITPTKQSLVIAAADHCLTAAYAGMCPGILPSDVIEYREITRTRLNGDLFSFRNDIKKAISFLSSAEKTNHFGCDFVIIDDARSIPEVGEAAARISQPIITIQRNQGSGQSSVKVKGAPPDVIVKLLSDFARNKFDHVYGCPPRGYAGARM